jgi:hypothetical protein
LLAALRRRREDAPADAPAWRRLALAATAAWLLALGEYVRIGGFWVVSLHWLYAPFYPVLAPLRAIGRFAWLPAALVLVAAARRIERRYAPRWAAALFAGAALLQALDLSALPRLVETPAARPGDADVATWEGIKAGGVRRMLLLPPAWPYAPCDGDDAAEARFVRYAMLALRVGLDINGAYTGRPRKAVTQAYCDATLARLDRHELDEAAAYVVAPSQRARFHAAADATWTCTPASDGHEWCWHRR